MKYNVNKGIYNVLLNLQNTMSCYIIKKPITHNVYTIIRNEKRMIVAFEEKKHASTYKRLLQDFISESKSRNSLYLHRMNKTDVVKMSNIEGLDCIIYSSDVNYLIYEGDNTVTDDIIFSFEMKFKYY